MVFPSCVSSLARNYVGVRQLMSQLSCAIFFLWSVYHCSLWRRWGQSQALRPLRCRLVRGGWEETAKAMKNGRLTFLSLMFLCTSFGRFWCLPRCLCWDTCYWLKKRGKEDHVQANTMWCSCCIKSDISLTAAANTHRIAGEQHDIIT